MGSEIVVKSVQGKGSEFSFIVNLKKDKRAASRDSKSNKVIDFSHLHILLAEDNIVNQIVIKEFFSVLFFNLE